DPERHGHAIEHVVLHRDARGERLTPVKVEEVGPRPLPVLDVEGVVQPPLIANALPHLGRDIRVRRQLTKRVTGREIDNAVNNHTDGDQRDQGDQAASNEVSTHDVLLRCVDTMIADTWPVAGHLYRTFAPSSQGEP